MKILKFIFACILTFFCISCGDEKKEENKKVEQIFYTVMPKQEYNFDIHLYSKNERALLTQIFEGLTELKENGVKLVSVTKIEHSEDFKEWSFTLRDDLKWSDGEKITAETYLESWLDTLSTANKSDEILKMFVIKGAKDFSNKKLDKTSVGIKADGNILKVQLNKSIKNFDEYVSNPIFFPTRKENKNLAPTEKIVNGAFKIFNLNEDEIILQKNENYWDSVNTRLKEVKISLVENEIMAYEMFPRYEIDYFGAPFYDLPYDRLEQANSLPEMMKFKTIKYYFISIPNETKEKFFANKDFKRLLYSVSDPEFMGKIILQNDSPSIFEHSHPTSQTLEEAKTNFENLKNKEHFNFLEVPYTAYYDSNLIDKKILLSTVKEWITNFKIPVRVTSNTDAPLTFKIEKYLVGTNSINDFYNYINEKYRANIVNEKDFLETMPVIPLLQEYDTVLTHSNVRGLIITPNGDVYLKYIYMQETE